MTVRTPQSTRRAAALAGWTALALVSPLWGQQTPVGRLSVTEVWVLDGNSRLDRLSRIRAAIETSMGTIWIADVREVWVIDPDGTREDDYIVAREGDGPGEVRGINRIDILPNGNIAVNDMSRNAIEIFTPAGESVRRITLPLKVGWIKGFAALPSGGFAISGGVFGTPYAIHQFGDDGAYIRSFGAPMEAEDMMARFAGTGGALDALADGSLLYSRAAPHEIIQYEDPALTTAAPEAHKIAAIEGLLKSPGDDILIKEVNDEGVPVTSFRAWYPQSRGVFGLGDGRVLNVITRSNPDPALRHTIWQLFDADGTLAAEERSDAVLYEPWFQCSNGDLLATRYDALGVTSLVRLRIRD